MWLRGRGVDGGTGDPRRAIEVLGSDKYLKGIVTRLRLGELIEWLESRR